MGMTENMDEESEAALAGLLEELNTWDDLPSGEKAQAAKVKPDETIEEALKRLNEEHDRVDLYSEFDPLMALQAFIEDEVGAVAKLVGGKRLRIILNQAKNQGISITREEMSKLTTKAEVIEYAMRRLGVR